MSEIAGSKQSYGTLGRDVGRVGRWFRLILGGALAGYAVYNVARASSASVVAELALYFVATTCSQIATRWPRSVSRFT